MTRCECRLAIWSGHLQRATLWANHDQSQWFRQVIFDKTGGTLKCLDPLILKVSAAVLARGDHCVYSSQLFGLQWHICSFFLSCTVTENKQQKHSSLLNNTAGEILEGKVRGQSRWLSDREEPWEEWMREQEDYEKWWRWRMSRAEEGWKKRKRPVLQCADAAKKTGLSLSFVNQYDVGFPLVCSHVVLVSYKLYGSLSMLLRPIVR